ncbi:MAG: hypothetical protein ACHQ0J_10180 [Candidatus Dormibacterales bacterium]
MRLAAMLVVGGAIALTGVLVGAWWAPYPIGLAIGILEPKGRRAIPLGALAGLLAWALPLMAAQIRYGLGPAASSLAAIMGFGHQGAVPVVLTLLVGTLLGVTGAWLGSAARRVATSAAR